MMTGARTSHGGLAVRLSVFLLLVAAVLVELPPRGDHVGAAPQTFFPIVPARFLDTRNAPASPVLGGTTRNLTVAGVKGVPADATAVALNVTATRATASTFITVWPAGSSRPTASNVNVGAGQSVPNMVVIGVGTAGQVSIYSDQGSVHVIVDVTGYFRGGLNPIRPTRLMDTRTGLGGPAIATRSTRALQVVGTAGIPATGVAAVALNVTAVYPTTPTFITVYPAGVAKPVASNLNVTPGNIIPNMVIVRVGTAGQVNIYNDVGTVNVLVDIMGWFSVDGGFNGVTPARILDTRSATCGTTLGPNETRILPVAGRGGVPASGVGAVALNVTATNPTAAGYLTVWPTGTPRPTASNLNTMEGVTVPNMVTVGLGTAGQINIYNAVGTVDVIVDAMGWFDGTTPGGTPTPCPITLVPGTYLVGSQMPPGRYTARGATSGCYWERLSGLGGTLDEIIANDFQAFKGQAIVDVSPSDVAFGFTGSCGSFVTSTPPPSPISVIYPGAHVVGSEIQPGTYRTNGQDGCYWERVTGFGGTLDEIIANDFMSTPGTAYVAISVSDAGFRSNGDCGIWVRV